MAIQFLNTLNFNQNEVVSFRLDNKNANPATPLGGQLYYNNAAGVVRFYDDVNSAWVTLADSLNAGVTTITSGNSGSDSTGNAITNQTSVTGAVTIQSFPFSGLALVGHVPDASGTGDSAKFLKGDGTWAQPGGVYSWRAGATSAVAGSSNPVAIAASDTLVFKAGSVMATVIDTGTANAPNITFNHASITTTPTTATGVTLASTDVFSVVTSMTNDTFGHITEIVTTPFTLPTIVSGVTAQNGVKNTGTATAPVIEVSYGVNSNVIGAATAGTITGTHYIIAAGSALGPNQAVVYDQIGDLAISEFSTATADVDMGTNGGSLFQIKNMKDPTDAQDAATKAYADGLLSSALTFKGTFNALTGEILTGVNASSFIYQLVGGNFEPSKARVAVAIGDLYIVATAGDFYANTATPLTPGDQVFGQDTAAADASLENDWAVVQSDTDVATYSAVGIGNTRAQASGAVASGYEGSNAAGDATGGTVNVEYTTGTARLSLRESTAAKLGITTVTAGTGIGVSYANGVATVSSSGNPSGARISLGATDTGEGGSVTKLTATSTEQAWTVNTNTLFNKTAILVTCEVNVIAGSTPGATVFPLVTRAGNLVTITFTLLPNAPTNDEYAALLISTS